MIRVEVTETDISEGCRSDMDCCPVARALCRASAPFFDGQGSGRVFCATDQELYIAMGHLCMVAPPEVIEFVEAFDEYDPGDSEGIGWDAYRNSIRPFAFEVPDLSSPEWTEVCAMCEYFFPPVELNEDGYCGECSLKREEVDEE